MEGGALLLWDCWDCLGLIRPLFLFLLLEPPFSLCFPCRYAPELLFAFQISELPPIDRLPASRQDK